MPELKKNSIHTITIDRYASDGQGIGRLDGMAVFVRGALRGETCQVSLMKVGKSCAWAPWKTANSSSPPPLKSAANSPNPLARFSSPSPLNTWRGWL